jgi:hypothetical protein
VLKLGDKEFNDRANYKSDEPNPDFYIKTDFEAVFPGCPQLKVIVMDYDLIFGDDLIGESILDLEDRYFSADWNSVPNKPIEYRELYHPSSAVNQGTVKMWVEILPTTVDMSQFKDFDIAPPPDEEFEVRVCVFETEELKMMDIEGTTDGFVKCFFEPDAAKETDTHFRNQDGACSWNYRLLHKANLRAKTKKMTFQVYDRDFFKSNDLIGESVLDLRPLIEDASLAKRPMSLTKDYYEQYLKEEFPEYTDLKFESDGQSFWVNLASKNEFGKIEVYGKLRLQIDVYPKVDAEKMKVGEAQSEPNVNPHLPPPEGRLTFSLNPCTMINQLVGPNFRRAGTAIIVMVLCIALCVALAPMLISDLMSAAILGIFGL